MKFTEGYNRSQEMTLHAAGCRDIGKLDQDSLFTQEHPTLEEAIKVTATTYMEDLDWYDGTYESYSEEGVLVGTKAIKVLPCAKAAA